MSMTRKPISTKQVRSTMNAFRTRLAARRRRSGISGSEPGITHARTPADVTSVRAKSSRHGKSTADKRNQ